MCIHGEHLCYIINSCMCLWLSLTGCTFVGEHAAAGIRTVQQPQLKAVDQHDRWLW